MIVVAMTIDFLQCIFTFIPGFNIVANFILAVLALCIFGIWFALLDINYFSGKKVVAKILTLFSTSIIELMPILDALPMVTVGVTGIILISRVEDLEKSKEVEPAQSQVRTRRILSPQELRALKSKNANDDESDGEGSFAEAA
jgi:hypothetical protein